MEKFFVITIDTEGDNLWRVNDLSQPISTHNADNLFRFQELCEKYNYIPTYLTNYEMAKSQSMIELGQTGIKNKTLEIGAHIHAWNQPPEYSIQKGIGKRGKPFLGEYPDNIVIQKIDYLTKLLQDTFQTEITSHRGGRWYFDNRILAELCRLNYVVDCTCTPGINWHKNKGWTNFSRGCNWENYPNNPFFFTNKSGDKIVEIPVTIDDFCSSRELVWFRPDGENEKKLLDLIHNNKNSYIEFMLHSSELTVGGSPRFSRNWHISKLYYDIECLFKELESCGYKGIGLSDYAKKEQSKIYEEREI